MGKVIADSSRFTRMQAVIKSRLFPDTCNIKRISQSDHYYDVTGSGAFYPLTGDLSTETSSFITYEDSTDIPCRVDDNIFTMVQQAYKQENVISQYNLYLPIDLTVNPDDLIVIDDREYNIVKVMDNSNWLEATRLQISALRVGNTLDGG